MRDRVEAGRSGGGNSYGYKVVRDQRANAIVRTCRTSSRWRCASSATTARLRVNGVALFGGACVEAEATHAPHVKGQEVSAACSLNVADIFDQQRRFWVRLHEKGGRFCEMPCHHTLEGYLGEYIERARLAEAVRVPCSRPSSIALRARGGSPYRRAGPPHQRVGHGPPACSLDQPHACLAFGWQV